MYVLLCYELADSLNSFGRIKVTPYLCSASHQQLDGTILVGSDSELTLTLSDGSTFIGCISGNITNAAGKIVSTETGKVNVILSNDCTWTLTADTYITSFKGEASHIKTNGHRLFVDGKEMKITQ